VRHSLLNVLWLSLKEVRSLFSDYLMLGLIIYSFTFAIIAMAQNTSQEVHNATIAIADEDRSQLSVAIAQDFLPPYFKRAQMVGVGDIDRLLDTGRFTFVLDIPPHFQSDVQAGRQPQVQVNIDATAAMQAGNGAGYVERIVLAEIARTLARTDAVPPDAVTLTIHLAFNRTRRRAGSRRSPASSTMSRCWLSCCAGPR
jgi:ABC-2 type transport system permease protein